MKKIILTLFASLLMSSTGFTADFTYGRGADEAEDSYMSDGANSGTNYSTENLMYVRNGSINQHPILRFSAIDADIAGETIVSATLTVVCRFTTADHTIAAYRIRTGRSWNISQVTWDDYLTSTAWGTAGAENTSTDIIGTASDSYNPVSEADDYHMEFDVTADVQAWADGDNNNGWMYDASGTSTASTQLWSANWGNSSVRPYLEITTGVAGDTPSPRRRKIIRINNK